MIYVNRPGRPTPREVLSRVEYDGDLQMYKQRAPDDWPELADGKRLTDETAPAALKTLKHIYRASTYVRGRLAYAQDTYPTRLTVKELLDETTPTPGDQSETVVRVPRGGAALYPPGASIWADSGI